MTMHDTFDGYAASRDRGWRVPLPETNTEPPLEPKVEPPGQRGESRAEVPPVEVFIMQAGIPRNAHFDQSGPKARVGRRPSRGPSFANAGQVVEVTGDSPAGDALLVLDLRRRPFALEEPSGYVPGIVDARLDGKLQRTPRPSVDLHQVQTSGGRVTLELHHPDPLKA